MQTLMDLHTHTVASVHAYSTLTENAREAKKNGLEILGVSDHGYGMHNTTLKPYWSNLRVLPAYLEGVRILKGIEMNIYNQEGLLFEEREFDRVDYVIASLHLNAFDWEGKERDEMTEFTDAYVHAIERYPEINIIGHPDDQRIPVDYEKLVRACKEHHVALEVNCASLDPSGFRQNARENQKHYLSLCKDQGVPIIINSDAHMSVHVGVHQRALALLEEIDFPEELVINTAWSKLESLLGYAL